MKVRASVKKICTSARSIHRRGVVRVICVNPKHKPAPGYSRGREIYGTYRRSGFAAATSGCGSG